MGPLKETQSRCQPSIVGRAASMTDKLKGLSRTLRRVEEQATTVNRYRAYPTRAIPSLSPRWNLVGGLSDFVLGSDAVLQKKTDRALPAQRKVIEPRAANRQRDE
jgi:hypothetical protein